MSAAASFRYARALSDLLLTPNPPVAAADLIAQARAFSSELAASAELREAFATPAVSIADKHKVARRLAGMLGMGEIATNLLYVLIDHGRMAALAGIIEEFQRLADEHAGVVRADVASHVALNAEQRTAVAAELSRVEGREVRATFAVDPSLLGGVSARVGSVIYDGSVRGQFESMAAKLIS